jgi:GNAT superfamily N-acetyltransferase
MSCVRANEQPIDTATVIVVRKATAADVARLAELSEILGYPVASSSLGPRLERLLARVEDAVLVAEAESGVVGWVHGAEQELLESGRRCEILGLVVDPAYRSHGVGRRLVTAVEQWAAVISGPRRSMHIGRTCLPALALEGPPRVVSHKPPHPDSALSSHMPRACSARMRCMLRPARVLTGEATWHACCGSL